MRYAFRPFKKPPSLDPTRFAPKGPVVKASMGAVGLASYQGTSPLGPLPHTSHGAAPSHLPLGCSVPSPTHPSTSCQGMEEARGPRRGSFAAMMVGLGLMQKASLGADSNGRRRSSLSLGGLLGGSRSGSGVESVVDTPVRDSGSRRTSVSVIDTLMGFARPTPAGGAATPGKAGAANGSGSGSGNDSGAAKKTVYFLKVRHHIAHI